MNGPLDSDVIFDILYFGWNNTLQYQGKACGHFTGDLKYEISYVIIIKTATTTISNWSKAIFSASLDVETDNVALPRKLIFLCALFWPN